MEFLLAVFLIAVYGFGCFVLGSCMSNRALRQDNERIRCLYHKATEKIARLETNGSARAVPSEAVSCSTICTPAAAPVQAPHKPFPVSGQRNSAEQDCLSRPS
jgi:hypothetical protein